MEHPLLSEPTLHNVHYRTTGELGAIGVPRSAAAEFNAAIQAASHFVVAGGLMPPETAHTVRATGTTPNIESGPFSVAAASLGGFWIVEALDERLALDLATRASAACGEKVELRPLQAVRTRFRRPRTPRGTDP